MSSRSHILCGICGAEVHPEVPQYFIEIECFRIMNARHEKIPRRGSREYHEAMKDLLPEIQDAYFRNPELYDKGHLWCPVCGNRLGLPRDVGEF